MTALPVKSILWAPTNSAHHNHLHVEGDPRFTGTPPPNNPGMSDSVWTIYVALAERFGEPAYFLDRRSSTDWTHMGWYNRRPIAGTSIWSQHAWSNAIDIGPYYGVAQQQKFYDFLTGDDNMALTANEEKFVKDLFSRMKEFYPNDAVPTAAGISTYLLPDVRKNIVTMDELQSIVASSGTVDEVARKLAKANAAKLARIKQAI